MRFAFERERRAAGLVRGLRRLQLELAAGPDTRLVVAPAARGPEPLALVRDDALLLALRVVEREEADAELRAFGEARDRLLEIVEVPDALAADLRDQARPRYRRGAEDVARARHVDARHGPIEMARLLVRELVKDAVAVLDVLVGRDRVQVVDGDPPLQPRAAALDGQIDGRADVAVENRRQRHELGDELALDLDQDVPWTQPAVRRRARQDVLDDEQPRALRSRLAHGRLGLGLEPQTAQLGERLVHELGLQRAALDLAPFADRRERDAHAVERQKEARRGLRVRAGVERDGASLDVDDGRPRRAPRRARRRLQVEGVEVVVVAAAVVRRLAVEPRDRAGENRQLLARVVADDANVAPDLGRLGNERQLDRANEPQIRRVVAEEAEVVHRVAVHGHEVDLLLVQEDGLGANGPRRHDVAIRQDQPALGVYDEARRLARLIPFRVECARRVDADRHDARRDPVERAVPARLLREGHARAEAGDDEQYRDLRFHYDPF